MNIRIYQINMKRDPNDVCFMGYDRLEKLQGTTAIDSAIYNKVFSGEVKCKTLEDVWVKFNQHHPRGYKARSLSKSDIVEVIGKDGASEFHYDTKLQVEKDAVNYDVLEMSGSRAVWKEVLAVYAVKTNTDQDNPQEVATMDDGKKQLLKDIFWEMNAISSRTESKTETQITETDDGHGNIVQTETTVTRTYLYITVSHKTVDEMAAQYGFNQEQKDYLAELLKDENNSLWSQVLYGITGGDGEIVTVALSQVGNVVQLL